AYARLLYQPRLKPNQFHAPWLARPPAGPRARQHGFSNKCAKAWRVGYRDHRSPDRSQGLGIGSPPTCPTPGNNRALLRYFDEDCDREPSCPLDPASPPQIPTPERYRLRWGAWSALSGAACI